MAAFLVMVPVSAALAAEPALRVNGVDISDVQLQLARRAVERAGAADAKVALQLAVEQVVGRELLLQAAREAGITVTPEEVQRSVAAKRAAYPTSEAFAKALAEEGIDERELARGEGEVLVLAKFAAAKVEPGITITPDEAQLYYDTHLDDF